MDNKANSRVTYFVVALALVGTPISAQDSWMEIAEGPDHVIHVDTSNATHYVGDLARGWVRVTFSRMTVVAGMKVKRAFLVYEVRCQKREYRTVYTVGKDGDGKDVIRSPDAGAVWKAVGAGGGNENVLNAICNYSKPFIP